MVQMAATDADFNHDLKFVFPASWWFLKLTYFYGNK